MFVPFITKRSPKPAGGGGGGASSGGGSRGGGGSTSNSGGSRGGSSGSSSGSGRGGSGSSSSGSGSGRGGSSSGSGSSSGTPRTVPLSGSTSSGRTSATAYGSGGGSAVSIPKGQLFAGRQQGGGTRGGIFGTQTYGSGYPGSFTNSSRGVAGHDFPYYFWPVVWSGAAIGGASYLYDSEEYGTADNSSRLGGALTTVFFTSASGNTTLNLIADNATTTSLADIVSANCSSLLLVSQTAISFDSSNSSKPQPEQAVQYYRASSIVLALSGYNDTNALNTNATADTPIPTWVNQTMLECVNQTIGAAAPLSDAASPSYTSTPYVSAAIPRLQIGGMDLVCMVWVAVYLLRVML